MMNPIASSHSHFSAGPARSPGDQLSCRLLRRGDVVLLATSGEADAFTLPLWRRQVRTAVVAAKSAGGAVIVDATELRFLSLRTLTALAEDAADALREGVEICLVTRRSRLARLACGDPRTARLSIRSTVDGALAALRLRDRPGRPRSTPLITPGEASADRAGQRAVARWNRFAP
ncbi:hypothetical protein [Nocardia blacklockiae]|uniref:hypothetical protein n=1 Tax=Nocardia blacklockiae TaxID=480036 RepID=UPI0018933CDA|nr:hypothetical protein [Nocardia blacklockiae]MBF6170973.1 hypothetical protein [Nocardia blacklockiae]